MVVDAMGMVLCLLLALLVGESSALRCRFLLVPPVRPAVGASAPLSSLYISHSVYIEMISCEMVAMSGSETLSCARKVIGSGFLEMEGLD